jgi:hypothetical protein
VRDGTIALKGSDSMGDGRIFLKRLRDTSFNKDLSSEPTFGRIHLAGQYLKVKRIKKLDRKHLSVQGDFRKKRNKNLDVVLSDRSNPIRPL